MREKRCLFRDGDFSFFLNQMNKTMKKTKERTTQLIQETLGVSLTILEVEALLAKFEKKSRSQAPYFDGRLLDKIELLKNALGRNVNVEGPAKR